MGLSRRFFLVSALGGFAVAGLAPAGLARGSPAGSGAGVPEDGITGLAAPPCIGQLRAARGLLGWSLAEAATRSGCAPCVLRALEHGRDPLPPERARQLAALYAQAGVGFVGTGQDCPGVRLTGTRGTPRNGADPRPTRAAERA